MQHDKLEEMLNKTWMYNTRIYKIISYKIDNEETIIVTDKAWLTFKTVELNRKLKDFLPVDEEDASLVISSRKAEVANITNTLLDNINQIKSGEFDPKKVKALNQTVQTMLNVFKTEAAILKMKEGK